MLLFQIMMNILQCREPEEKTLKFAPLVLYMIPYEDFQHGTVKINLHGSLIVQEMLQFNKPIKVVNSLLSMSDNDLINLLSDPRGCHITEAFASSSFVGEKSRERLFKKLKVSFTIIAYRDSRKIN